MTKKHNPALPDIEVIAVRKQKLAKLRAEGPVFPNAFRRSHYSQQLQQDFAGLDNAELTAKTIEVKLAGRIKLKRIMGKAAFIQVVDVSGDIQIYLSKDNLGEDAFNEVKALDIGDIVGIQGSLFKTRTGELTVQASAIQLLVKALRPLPDKFHGLSDTELRYRNRYVDLIINQETREVFAKRSRIISAIREFFHAKDFLEVETPMMHPIPGGAAARPFTTHHNTLDMPLFLRIAPELYLKKLVVGGLEKVFELNRNFRNEGMSTQHNPEFTMLEFYWAYHDYQDLMQLTEQLLKQLVNMVNGDSTIVYQGTNLDFGKPFRRITIKEAVIQYNQDIKLENYDDIEHLRACCQALAITIPAKANLGHIHYLLFEHTVEEKLLEPTFVTEFPVEVSPLSRRNDTNPEVVDRFELFIHGKEIANGFSELNDADDQASRFHQQVSERQQGDLEAMLFDDDYIQALEHGLPPTAGEGIGIDRLVMLLTNSASIRDVLLFPLLRIKSS